MKKEKEDGNQELGTNASPPELAEPINPPAASVDNAAGGSSPQIIRVQQQPSAPPATEDLVLWSLLRSQTEVFNLAAFKKMADNLICGRGDREQRFVGIKAYDDLNEAADAWMRDAVYTTWNWENILNDLRARDIDSSNLDRYVREFQKKARICPPGALPYLGEVALGLPTHESCEGIVKDKLCYPLFIELIWSYWHEEGMLVQAINSISLRFQNKRHPAGRDPLAGLALDPLRRLNNLLWGYIQDEQHRLTLVRRAYEYDQHYGLTLQGTAVPKLESADSRSKFLEAFHNLLLLCSRYYKQLDNTIVRADPFPLLNALRDVHILLTEGMHNQYGDLPWTARKEMLIQQYLLSRSEMREFLSGRPMVHYDEPWMDRVDSIKRLQGWTDVSVTHFHNLAVWGEQLLLSLRFGNWNSHIAGRDQAGNWAIYFRNEIQGYIHDYRAVTGVDLTAEASDPRQIAERDLPPSIHLARRWQLQRSKAGNGASGRGRLPLSRLSPGRNNGALQRNGSLAEGEF